jgi:phosphatidylserine decarboxylase
MEVVENAASSHLESSRLMRVSIFMSIFDVHVNRSPISGTVKKITYTAGRFLDAREKASSEINEQNSVVLEGEAETIEVVQVAGKIARRITCWVSVDDEVRCGDRFGIVHFGSRLDVYLPEEFIPLVRAGIRVKAGLTPIAGRAHR